MPSRKNPPSDPKDVEATSRTDMWCYSCRQQSLGPTQFAKTEDWPSKKKQLIYATECKNEYCDQHKSSEFQEKYVRMQYSEQSGLANLISFVTSPALFLLLLVLVTGIGGAYVTGFGPIMSLLDTGGGESSTVEVNGKIYTPNGELATNESELYFNGEWITVENGTFSGSVEPGVYTVYARTTGSGAHPPVKIQVSESGKIVSRSESNYIQVSENVLQLRSVELKRVSTEKVDNGYITSFNSKNNVNMDSTVTLVSEGTDDIRQGEAVAPSGSLQKFTITGIPQSEARLNLNAERISVQQSVSGVYTESRVFSVSQSGSPSNAQIRVRDISGTVQERSYFVNGETQQTVTVSGSNTVRATVRLYGGEGESSKAQTGQYSNNDANPTFTVEDEDAPASVTYTIEGVQVPSEENINGQLSKSRTSTIPLSLKGNLAPTDGVLKFTGGVQKPEEVGSERIDTTGEERVSDIEKRVFIASQPGSYTMNFDTVIDNSEYVSYGYRINDNERVEVTDKDSVNLQLSGGDNVYVWAVAKPEIDTSGNSDYKFDSESVELISYSVSTTSVQPGDSVQLEATLVNRGTTDENVYVRPVLNGDAKFAVQKTVPAGESITVDAGQVEIPDQGLHTVSVSSADSTVVESGTVDRSHGEISLDATAEFVGEGQVRVDTNGDGSYDCVANHDGGTCEISQEVLENGEINVEQVNIKDTSYRLDYIAWNGQKNVSVDVDNDGEAEIEKSGALEDGERISTTQQFKAGTHEVDMTVGSGTVPYEIEWSQTGVVNQPTMVVNGETVIDEEESFEGSRTYTVELEPGENNVNLSAGDGSYQSEIIWEETTADVYPDVVLNSETVCTGENFVNGESGVCTIPSDSFTSGDNTLQMTGEGVQKRYELTYETTHVADEITVQLNDETVQVNRDDVGVENGEWRTSIALQDVLKQGENRMYVEASSEEVDSVEASARVSYDSKLTGVKNPVIVMKNNNGTYRHDVTENAPDDMVTDTGRLDGEYTFEVPDKWTTEGYNEYYVETENDNTVYVKIEANKEVEFEGSGFEVVERDEENASE